LWEKKNLPFKGEFLFLIAKKLLEKGTLEKKSKPLILDNHPGNSIPGKLKKTPTTSFLYDNDFPVF